MWGIVPRLPPSEGLRLFSSQNFSRTIPHIVNRTHTSYLLAYENGTECSETLIFKLQTPVNHPEESTKVFFSLVAQSRSRCRNCGKISLRQGDFVPSGKKIFFITVVRTTECHDDLIFSKDKSLVFRSTWINRLHIRNLKKNPKFRMFK
jgi:hypothetical protein